MDRYQLGETVRRTLDVYNASSGALEDPASTPTITVYQPDGDAEVDAADATKSSTGLYYYDWNTDSSDAIGTYKVKWTITDGTDITIRWDRFELTNPLSPTMGWCVDALAAHLRGIIDVNPDASGSDVPSRIITEVRNLGMWLYNAQDWRFRSYYDSLTISDGDTTEAMPSDFAELDQRLMRTGDSNRYRLLWTSDPEVWLKAKERWYSSDATGAPRFACLEWSESDGQWQARIAPESDDDYTYYYWYLKRSPWERSTVLTDTTVMGGTYWPHTFDHGWKLLCEKEVLRHYRRDDAWKDARSEFREWYMAQREENDEAIAQQIEEIEDDVRDHTHTTRALFSLAELPGGEPLWYGST